MLPIFFEIGAQIDVSTHLVQEGRNSVYFSLRVLYGWIGVSSHLLWKEGILCQFSFFTNFWMLGSMFLLSFGRRNAAHSSWKKSGCADWFFSRADSGKSCRFIASNILNWMHHSLSLNCSCSQGNLFPLFIKHFWVHESLLISVLVPTGVDDCQFVFSKAFGEIPILLQTGGNAVQSPEQLIKWCSKSMMIVSFLSFSKSGNVVCLLSLFWLFGQAKVTKVTEAQPPWGLAVKPQTKEALRARILWGWWWNPRCKHRWPQMFVSSVILLFHIA